MKIWCLFSIANNYDQPYANLEAWWVKKPDFAELAIAVGITVDIKKGHSGIGRLLKNKESRIDDTDFRLEEIPEGKYE